MIEKMKKLTLVVHHSAKDKFLSGLQKLGVVHLEVNKAVSNEEIKISSEGIARFKKDHLLLTVIKKETKSKYSQKDYKGDLNNLLSEVEERNEKINKLKAEFENLKKELELLTPWGNFNPDIINKLSENNICLKYYSAPSKKFEAIDKELLNIEIIQKVRDKIYFIVICKNNNKPELEANEERIPIKNIKVLEKEIDALEKDIKNERKALEAYICYEDLLNKEILSKTNKLDYCVALENMIEEAEGNVLILQGWVPAKHLKSVEEFLSIEDAVNILDDPEAGDKIPILLKNNIFSKLFEPITKMHSLPQYTEIDPTPFIAPFFALFFGLCLADIGYGIVLLLSVVLSMILIRKKSAMPILVLGLILSLTTILGGIILDSFFGASNFSKLIDMQVFPVSYKKFILFEKMEDQMSFAVALGVIQVTVGLILQIINKIKQNGILYGLQPLGSILLLLSGIMAIIIALAPGITIGPAKIGDFITKTLPYPSKIAIGLAASGAVITLLFNNINKSIFIRPLTGLWELYGLVTGVPGDILSYMRLFALGLSGSLLGNAFNQIAMMVRGEPATIPGYIFMILILLFGHGINIALAALGAFVHPLRLMLLEFYKAMGFNGGGLPYSPFKNR